MSKETVEIVRQAHAPFQDGSAPRRPPLRRVYRGREQWTEFMDTWTATGKASGVPVSFAWAASRPKR